MAERVVALVVQQAGNCKLLKAGDRWLVAGREISKVGEARLCGGGICSLLPKLQNILSRLPPALSLPDDYMSCGVPGCDAAFRMEFAQPQGQPVDKGLTQKMAPAAEAATAAPKKKGAPFLSRLPREVATELITACTTTRYEDGQIILMQGVAGQHLYIVAEGGVQVTKRGEFNDQTVLATLGRGDCFGEMSILTGEVTSADVRSQGKAAILSVQKDALEAMLVKRPLLSREFSKLLAERLKASNVSLQSGPTRGIIGRLSMISLPDLVQALHQSRRTGTLVVNCLGTQGRLGFRNGFLCTAKTGSDLGNEAFYTMVKWPEGDFCFEQTEPKATDPGKVISDTVGLLMEAARRLDDAKARKP